MFQAFYIFLALGANFAGLLVAFDGCDSPKNATDSILIMHYNDAQPRLNILELEQNQPQRDLFLLALKQMQERDWHNQSSFFMLAGIHGYPVLRGGADFNHCVRPTGMYSGGYCAHRSPLFPVWHRAYMLLFENVLHRTAHELVAQYASSLQAKYTIAANALRLPFFDWANNSTLPAIVIDEKVSVENFYGTTISIDNPLRSFTFPFDLTDATDENVPPMRMGMGTERYPRAQDPTRCLQKELTAFQKSFRFGWCATLMTKQYSTLHNEASASHSTEPADSADELSMWVMEGVHDDVHDVLGGTGGHMANAKSGGFDPVFLLHHSNIDRLLAFFELTNPNAWLEVSPTHPEITPDSTLPPFRNQEGELFTASTIRNAKAYGYYYAEEKEFVGIESEKIRSELLHRYSCMTFDEPMWFVRLLIRNSPLGSLLFTVTIRKKTSTGEHSQSVQRPLSLTGRIASPQPLALAISITDIVHEMKLTDEDLKFHVGGATSIDLGVVPNVGGPLSLHKAGVEEIELRFAPLGLLRGKQDVLIHNTKIAALKCEPLSGAAKRNDSVSADPCSTSSKFIELETICYNVLQTAAENDNKKVYIIVGSVISALVLVIVAVIALVCYFKPFPRSYTII